MHSLRTPAVTLPRRPGWFVVFAITASLRPALYVGFWVDVGVAASGASGCG
jgi:hypothetical protein